MPDFRRCLPADWSQNKLHKITAAITSGGTPTSGDPRYYCEGEGIPFAKTEDLSRSNTKWISECELNISVAALKETAAKIYPEGTILLSMYGTIGLPKITTKELSANQALCALIPPFKCDLDYLYHHLVFTRDGWKKFSGQTTQANINGYIVRNHDIPLPSPREQQKIAQILDTLDTQIQKTEALIAKLEKIKEGLLHDLLTRGIDQNGQLRPAPEQAPELYKESALGLIPKEWEVLPAEAVCESVIDCKNRTPPERTTGFPVIRTPNVRNGRFVYSDLLFTDRKSYEIWTQRGAPRPGDIVITREAPVGEVCKIPTTMKHACLGQRMMMYQPDPSIIHTDYMLAALVSRRVQNRLLDLAGGSTVGHVKVGDIRQLSIPTPPVCEQTLIAENFNSIESRLRNEAHELEKLRLEKSGLMDDLLTGRVRVTSLLKDAV